jgi:hypothetical protein
MYLMKKLFVFFFMLLAFGLAPATLAPAAYAQAPAAHHDAAAGAKSCADCAAECEKTLAYFNKKGGKYIEAKNVDTIKDCLALCKASADLKTRKSAYAAKLDAVCHEVCSKCAQVCKDLKDPALKECITSCETCHKCCE